MDTDIFTGKVWFDVVASRLAWDEVIKNKFTRLSRSGNIHPSEDCHAWLMETDFACYYVRDEVKRELRYRFHDSYEASLFAMAFGLPIKEIEVTPENNHPSHYNCTTLSKDYAHGW